MSSFAPRRDRVRRRRTLYLPVVAASMLAACGDVSVGRVERCALGAHAAPQGATPGAALEDLERLIGQRVAIDRQYYRLGDPAPGEYERKTSDAGRTPLISIASTLPFARIADPADPTAAPLVADLARRLREFERPIYVVFQEKPTDDTDLGTAEEFTAAWRRVVDAARAAGASNATWVWTMGSGAFPSVADAWYPGDEWVDYAGVTGFNWFSPGDPWRTFPSIFGPFHMWAEHRRDEGSEIPSMIVAVASDEHAGVPDGDPRSKAVWIHEALDTLQRWPDVHAFVWHHGSGGTDESPKDWRVNSSPAALEAFRDLAASPHFDITGERISVR